MTDLTRDLIAAVLQNFDHGEHWGEALEAGIWLEIEAKTIARALLVSMDDVDRLKAERDATREVAKGEPSTQDRRISEELELMKTAGIIEIAVRNPNVADYMRHWEARATSAETTNAALTARVAELEAELPALLDDAMADAECVAAGRNVTEADRAETQVTLDRIARVRAAIASHGKKTT